MGDHTWAPPPSPLAPQDAPILFVFNTSHRKMSNHSTNQIGEEQNLYDCC